MIDHVARTTATVLLSGGVDSAACAHYLRSDGHIVRCLHLDYGQKARLPEKEAALSLSRYLDIPLEVISVNGGATLGAGEIIGRNGFLVLTALAIAQVSTGVIALGIHSGTPYYDCSPAFCSLADRMIAEYTDGLVRFIAPFLDWTKRQIFDYSVRSGLPLRISYSCEAGTVPPCGKCLSCRDRRLLGCAI